MIIVCIEERRKGRKENFIISRVREKKERAPWRCDICVRMTERKREGEKGAIDLK